MRTLAMVFALAACSSPEDEPDPSSHELVEPDVFDVIRASNSRAAVEALRDRYEQEIQHARLLEARIGELIAAEEGLALEHHERLTALQSIKDQVRKLADEQAALARALDEATKANAALELQIQQELARRAELNKKLGDEKPDQDAKGGGD